MHFAHLPAGYITSKLLFRKFEKSPVKFNRFAFWGMLGSIAPDFDFIYYFFIDHKDHHHHEYFTHFPIFWLSLLLISLLWLSFDTNHKHISALAVIFSLNGLIHMLLDTIAGFVVWLAPFADMDKPFTLGNYIPWDTGFLEFFIFLWALYLWKKPQIVGLFSRLGSSLDLIE
ncbi:MAG: metal-dependent hydrolase [Chlorobiaceae bacterium]